MDKNVQSQSNKKSFNEDTLAKKVGDKVEKVGRKISDAGDRLEHSQDKPQNLRFVRAEGALSGPLFFANLGILYGKAAVKLASGAKAR